jgi:hypothetical protein
MGADLRHVLHDSLQAIGNAGTGNAAEMESHGDESAVAATPFRFRIVDYGSFAGIGEEFGERFGIAKHVIRQIQGLHVGKAGAGKDL